MQVTEAGTTLVFNDATPEELKRILSAAKEPTPAKPKMLTRKQVASLLGVHTETVKRYGRKGLLKTIRFSARAVRYSEAEVLNFMRTGACSVEGVK